MADRETKLRIRGRGVTRLSACLACKKPWGSTHPPKHTKPACYTPVILASGRWKKGIRVSRLSLATEQIQTQPRLHK